MVRSLVFLLLVLWSSTLAAEGFILSGDAFSSTGGALSGPGEIELGFTGGQSTSGNASTPGPGSGFEESAGFWRWMLWQLATDVGDEKNEGLLSVYRLEPGYPNPFNPGVTIRFAIPNSAVVDTQVRLRICNASARLVRVLVDEPVEPGLHNIVWDGHDDHGRRVSSGVYFIRMDVGVFHASQKLVMLK